MEDAGARRKRRRSLSWAIAFAAAPGGDAWKFGTIAIDAQIRLFNGVTPTPMFAPPAIFDESPRNGREPLSNRPISRAAGTRRISPPYDRARWRTWTPALTGLDARTEYRSAAR